MTVDILIRALDMAYSIVGNGIMGKPD